MVAALKGLWPGVLACAVVAAAAAFLGEHYGAPTMLFALLLGLALNFLAEQGPCGAGIQFAARHLLRLGVALLGLRITTAQVAGLGWQPALLVLGGVAATITVGVLAARAFGYRVFFGLLTGGAVAICGASAALAIAAALPRHPLREQATLFTVIGVSVLSTLAMVAYPMVAAAAGLDAAQTGVFLGATIHDVAQVVGAGYGVSAATGDVATVVKLLRVALLMPVILLVALVARRHGDAADGGTRPPLLPGFVIGFVVLVALNSAGWVPAPLARGGAQLASVCLVAAIAAIGMKTQLRDLLQVGWRPVALIVGETLFLAALVLAALAAGVSPRG